MNAGLLVGGHGARLGVAGGDGVGAPVLTPDLDLTVLEDLDFEAPCVVQVIRMVRVFGVSMALDEPKQCENPAAWVVTCKVCGKGGLLCGEHHAHLLSYPIATCANCKASGPVLALFSLAPLPAGRP